MHSHALILSTCTALKLILLTSAIGDKSFIYLAKEFASHK